MRPLAFSLLSGAGSIAFGIASHASATRLDISSVSSTATFTHLLTTFFSLLATLACLWICLSYLLLAYAQRMSHRPSIVLRYATRFAIPRVRRHLIAAMTLSLVVAQPAYAQDYDSIPSDSPIDISWGSPDLLEIAAQTAMDNTPTGNIPPTENPTETPTKAQPSPVPSLNPLTSSTSPPAIYTVKSGDTLWDIAKAHLPPGSTDSDIARACLIWTAANPTLANPNLIYPEQTLTIPQENLL